MSLNKDETLAMDRSDIELINTEDNGRSWELYDERPSPRDSDRLTNKCAVLLKLCDTVDLKQLGPSDISKLHNIVKMAHSISEETNTSDSEKFRLMEGNTTKMLLNVSRALSKMDQQLMTIRETSLQHIELLYENSNII